MVEKSIQRCIPWEEGHMKIRVNRGSLLQDAVDAFESIEPADIEEDIPL